MAAGSWLRCIRLISVFIVLLHSNMNVVFLRSEKKPVHHISELASEFLLHHVAEAATLRYGAIENVLIDHFSETIGLLERTANGQQQSTSWLSLVTVQAVRESCYAYADVYCSVCCCSYLL